MMTPVTTHDRCDLLAAVESAVASARSAEEIVNGVLAVLVPRFAVLTTIETAAARAASRQVGTRTSLPGQGAIEYMIRHRQRVEGDGIGSAWTIATGESQLLAPMTVDHLRAMTHTEADLEMLRDLYLHSAVIVPLRHGDQTLGALSCAASGARDLYDETDLALAEEFGEAIGIALAGLTARD